MKIDVKRNDQIKKNRSNSNKRRGRKKEKKRRWKLPKNKSKI